MVFFKATLWLVCTNQENSGEEQRLNFTTHGEESKADGEKLPILYAGVKRLRLKRNESVMRNKGEEPESRQAIRQFDNLSQNGGESILQK